MRKLLNAAMLILIVAVTVTLALWAYKGITRKDFALQQGAVPDAEISCLKVPDTGQCMCRHRDTNQKIEVSYDDCVRRALRAQR